MSEYIEREALLSELQEEIEFETSMYTEEQNKYFNMGLKCAIRDVKSQPAADVVEVRHGKWQPCFEDWRKQIEGDECSACGFRHYGTNMRDYHFCPNCGAKMDGDTNDEL